MRSVSSRSRPMPYSGWTCPPSALAHDVVQPAQVVLHRADFGQAVERAHDEEGVAQPAVAVVPVALAVGRLGNAGGHRRDDRAGLLELAQLERDRRADHRLLPLAAAIARRRVQRRQYSARLLLEVARGFLDAARQRFVGAEQQADRRVQREPGLVDDIGRAARWCSGAASIAGSTKRRWLLPRVSAGATAAPFAARPEHDADARMAAQRAHAAHQLRRPEHTLAVEEARREVGDLDALAGGVEQARAQHRRAGVVGLLGARQAFELDRAGCRRRDAVGRIEQRVEHRDRRRSAACSTRRCRARASISALMEQLPTTAMPSEAGTSTPAAELLPSLMTQRVERVRRGSRESVPSRSDILTLEETNLRDMYLHSRDVRHEHHPPPTPLSAAVDHHAGRCRVPGAAADGPAHAALVLARPQHARRAGHQRAVRFDRRSAGDNNSSGCRRCWTARCRTSAWWRSACAQGREVPAARRHFRAS